MQQQLKQIKMQSDGKRSEIETIEGRKDKIQGEYE
jgi:hypothetical protein